MADDYASLIQEARRAGATVTKAPGGHLKIWVPGGHLVVASVSPSNRKAVHDLRAELRRAGLFPRNGLILSDDEQDFLTRLADHGQGRCDAELPPKRLRDKGLIRISKRRTGWMVWLTEKGRQHV